jgi:alkylated DNA repair protein alkB homolog 1
MWEEYQDICTNSPSELHTARLRRLRWSCMGYHYDWTNRSYSPDKRSVFPDSNPIQNEYRKIAGKSAESVIVNFYHSHRAGDRLGGHRDDCEESLSPLLLLSLGLPGILLLGDDCGVLLRSGDAVVFKDDGRFALHGVPCVFSGSSKAPDGSVDDLLLRTRISLSIRCVWYRALR